MEAGAAPEAGLITAMTENQTVTALHRSRALNKPSFRNEERNARGRGADNEQRTDSTGRPPRRGKLYRAATDRGAQPNRAAYPDAGLSPHKIFCSMELSESPDPHHFRRAETPKALFSSEVTSLYHLS